ncbi:MAG: hypothetical protein IJU78_01025 [Clostridia bacterium]|nr:hypothetical protein [Clostridia bacterium]
MKENEKMNELEQEYLQEIEEWVEQEHDEPGGYYFSNPDPYLKPQPLPPDRRRHNYWIGEDGHIHVKNLSAFWIPELTVTEVIHGTVYTVTGSYEGNEPFVRKLERITGKKFTESLEGDA